MCDGGLRVFCGGGLGCALRCRRSGLGVALTSRVTGANVRLPPLQAGVRVLALLTAYIGCTVSRYIPDYLTGHMTMSAMKDRLDDRLEAIRDAIRAETVSYGEIAELQTLAAYIDPSDVELRQWADVPEDAGTSDSVPMTTPLAVVGDLVHWTNDDGSKGYAPVLAVLRGIDGAHYSTGYRWQGTSQRRLVHASRVTRIGDGNPIGYNT